MRRTSWRCPLPGFQLHTLKRAAPEQKELRTDPKAVAALVPLDGFVFCSSSLKSPGQKVLYLITSWEARRKCLMTASQEGKESSGRWLHSSFRSLLPSGVPRCLTRYSTKTQISFSSGLLGGFSHRSTRSFTVPGSTLHLSFIFRHFHCPLLTLLQPSWLSLSFFNYQVLPCQGEFAPAVLSACQVPRIPSLKPHIICLTSS